MTARFSHRELVWLPIVLAALAGIYLPSLGNLPVLDDAYLADGRLFTDYRKFELRVRMLSYGTFVWLQALFGEGWWKQRLVNLAIHVGVVVALWALYREILRHIAPPAAGPGEEVPYDRSPALGFAIGFFALNPVAVYAVAYLIQRSILLATLFVVLGLWLFARGLATRKPWLHALGVVCYALAVMSKEHALLAPLAALPLYILIARPGAKRLALIGGSGALLVGIAGFVLSYRYGPMLGKAFDEYSHVYLAQLAQLNPGAARRVYPLSILNQAYLFFEYGLRWFFPASGWLSINLRPPFPVRVFSFPQLLGIFGYLAVVAGGFFLVWRYRDWRALIAVSLLMPALLFATEFVTVWVQDPFVLYRSYLWAIGIPGLVFFLAHGAPARVLLAVGVALAALFTWQALDRVMSLENPERAWTDAIAKLPNDPRSVGRWFPYLNRGAGYVERNEFDRAMRDFEASAALGDLGMGSVNLGSLLAAKGRHREALAAFDRAESQGYTLYNLPMQRGLSLAAVGRPADAYIHFRTTTEWDPPSPTRELALLNLGRTGLQIGRNAEAVKALSRLVEIDPGHKEGRYLLAMALITVHEYARARDLLDRLLKDDNRGAVYYARALANYGLKKKSEALRDIETALRFAPQNPNLREWHAKIQAMP